MSITFSHVSFQYSRSTTVLQDLDVQFKEGELLLVIGHNGAGKSTLLKLLNGILKPTGGKIVVDGRDTNNTSTFELAHSIAVTFQNPADQIFASTVWKEVAFGPTNLRRPNIDELVTHALSLLNLQNKRAVHPYDLPQADRKLLTVASAIAMGSPYLAFDEPTAGLSQTEKLLLRPALDDLIANQRTVIVVSHDLEYFFPLSTKALILNQGVLAFHGPTKELLQRDEIIRAAGLRLPPPFRIKAMLGEQPY